jgi:hypothetical protein
VVRAWRWVLDWFGMMHANPRYEEVGIDVVKREDLDENGGIKLGWD